MDRSWLVCAVGNSAATRGRFGKNINLTPQIFEIRKRQVDRGKANIRDFVDLAREMGVRIERCYAVNRSGTPRETNPGSGLANLFAIQAVFLLGEPA